MVESIKQWYTLSKRRETTFQKLYEHPYLSWRQIDKLKTAQALYELVPISLYAPYLFLMMRQVAKANTSALLARFVLLAVLTAPSVEVGARTLRDRLYWPIVRKTYLEVKDSSRKSQQLPFFMLQAMQQLPSPLASK